MTSTDAGPEQLIATAVAAATDGLAQPGDWLTAAQRLDAWSEVRDARTNPIDAARAAAISPTAVAGHHQATDELSADAVEVLHRIASDPGRLSATWAGAMIESLGEETYVELVGVAATAMAVDVYRRAAGLAELVPAGPVGGDPARRRPEDVGDVGAWVSQSLETTMANVSRALSLTPVQNMQWVGLVQAMYSRGADFLNLEWDRALSRPQVELVAARTTAELECFY